MSASDTCVSRLLVDNGDLAAPVLLLPVRSSHRESLSGRGPRLVPERVTGAGREPNSRSCPSKSLLGNVLCPGRLLRCPGRVGRRTSWSRVLVVAIEEFSGRPVSELGSRGVFHTGVHFVGDGPSARSRVRVLRRRRRPGSSTEGTEASRSHSSAADRSGWEGSAVGPAEDRVGDVFWTVYGDLLWWMSKEGRVISTGSGSR